MKGMIMSPIVFLIFISIFSIAYVFSMNTIQLRENVAQDILANRIYYKFLTISDSVEKIIEMELGDINKTFIFNTSVDEQPDFSYVNITEKWPQDKQDVSNLNQDLGIYENFTKEYLNETNVVVDTDISSLGQKMRVAIEPYGIVFDQLDWGTNNRQFWITSNNLTNGLDELNSYTLSIQLTNGETVASDVFKNYKCNPEKSGDLKVTFIVISYGGTPMSTTTKYLSREKSTCYIATSNGTISVTIDPPSWHNPGSMMFDLTSTDAIVTVSLNLTDIPGKTELDLPDGKINVIESLYSIQKNDTVHIGE